MLKSVVQQKYIYRLLRLDALAFHVTIGPNTKNRSIAKPFFHHFYFIAASGGAPIAAAENSYVLSFLQESLGQPKHHWCFTRAADRQVSHADHRRAQTFRRINSLRVQPRV